MTQGRILVVDDEYFIRSAIQLYLESEGYKVTTAGSGEEALDLLGTQHYDVAILDIRMPGLGGLDVLREIRERRLSVEVIFATGCGTVDTALEAVRLGAFDYIEKPITEFEGTLLKVTQRAVQRKRLVVANRRLAAELRYLRAEARRSAAEHAQLNHDLEALHEVSLLLAGSGEPETVLRIAGHSLEQSFQITRGIFFLRDPEERYLMARTFGFETGRSEIELADEPPGILERLREGDSPVLEELPGTLEGEAISPPLILVPLLAGRDLVGVLLGAGLAGRLPTTGRQLILLQLGLAVGACLEESREDLIPINDC